MKTSKKQTTPQSERYFVIDTNVLLHDALSIYAFAGVTVAIPFVVLEELDTFKKDTGERGRNARHVIRNLDDMRSTGSLNQGVPFTTRGKTSILKVIQLRMTPGGRYLCSDSRDNEIIHTVLDLMRDGHNVTFVTKDINARVKADTLGIKAEDYTEGSVVEEQYYKGWKSITVPAATLRTIGTQRIGQYTNTSSLCANEYVILESDKNPENFRVFRYVGGSVFKEALLPKIRWPFTARNREQIIALDLLFDDDIKLVSLLGPAGTGKTFLTLLAGLHKVMAEHVYKKLLIARPIVALGADIGFLPGDMQEKLYHWMKPIHDNLEYIFSEEKHMTAEQEQEANHDQMRKKDKKHKKRHDKSSFHRQPANEVLQQRGILNFEAITYMRGRSIPRQYIFIDEVQNLTPHEVKTIVSRAGEGSKIILAGDPHQIDSPYLDFSSNGLTITSERFKGQSIFGTVYLERSERSKLAELAAKLL